MITPSSEELVNEQLVFLKRGARHDPVDHVAETATGGAQVLDEGVHGSAVCEAGLAADGVGQELLRKGAGDVLVALDE